jgi:transporter family protein
MKQWLPAALVALFSFGLWGFFSKLTLFYIDSKSALIFQTLGVLLIGLITLAMLDFKPATDIKAFHMAF